MLYKCALIFFLISFKTHAAPKCMHCHMDNSARNQNYSLIDLTKNKIPDNCQSCHVNIHAAVEEKRPITWPTHLKNGNEKLFDRDYLFVNNPALIYKIKDITRFTDCGFKSFLKNPVSRKYNTQVSMFPLSDEEINSAIIENKIPLEKCTTTAFKSDDIKKGKELYNSQCLSCHNKDTASDLAPKLRMGYPLLSQKYFEHRVYDKGINRNQNFIYNYYWKTDLKKIQKVALKNDMPIFSKLTKQDITALYAYISTSDEDIQSIRILESESLSTHSPIDLYNVVNDKIFSGSCKHCHFDANSMINFVFDTKKKIPSLFNENQPLLKSDDLTRLFSVGEKCQPSLMENVLRERHLEFKGKKSDQSLKGMPLNLKPLSLNTIKNIRQWTLIGCPSPSGFLCTKRENCKS